jgi:hypothetical protein
MVTRLWQIVGAAGINAGSSFDGRGYFSHQYCLCDKTPDKSAVVDSHCDQHFDIAHLTD